MSKVLLGGEGCDSGGKSERSIDMLGDLRLADGGGGEGVMSIATAAMRNDDSDLWEEVFLNMRVDWCGEGLFRERSLNIGRIKTSFELLVFLETADVSRRSRGMRGVEILASSGVEGRRPPMDVSGPDCLSCTALHCTASLGFCGTYRTMQSSPVSLNSGHHCARDARSHPLCLERILPAWRRMVRQCLNDLRLVVFVFDR